MNLHYCEMQLTPGGFRSCVGLCHGAATEGYIIINAIVIACEFGCVGGNLQEEEVKPQPLLVLIYCMQTTTLFDTMRP